MKHENARALLSMLLTGLFIGVAAIAPGVSGGAIAVVFGLYEPITAAIGTIWKDFRQKVRFLAPLGIGAVVGVLLFGKLINFLFLEYYSYTCAVFVGLIVGTLPSVFSDAARDGFRLRYLLATLLCGVLVAWAASLDSLQYTGTYHALPYWLSMVCGGIVGLGSILPGTSASFVLMALGIYQPMLHALDTLDVPRLVLMGVGFCVVFVMFSRLLNWAFRKAHGWMSFATAGMLIGSVVSVIPTPARGFPGMIMLCLAVGSAVLSYSLLRIKK